MRIFVLILLFLCSACATNSALDADSPEVVLTEWQVQCIDAIKIEPYSSEEYKSEKVRCIKDNSSHTFSAVLKSVLSVATLFVGIG
jgi:hypothetical protein